MSKSKKHTPIWGFTSASSEKYDKRILHGKLRTRLRVAVKRMLLERSSEDYISPQYDEVHNKWKMAKDGKIYWHPKKYGGCIDFKKLMRK